MANKIHPAKAVLVAALVAAGAFGAVTYNQAKSHLSEVAAAEKGWRQFPASPPALRGRLGSGDQAAEDGRRLGQ